MGRLLGRRGEDFRLCVRRNGNVEDFDGSVGQQVLPALVDLGDAAEARYLFGLLRAARADGGHVVTCIAIGDELDVANDEARADDADAVVLFGGPGRLVVEVEVGSHERIC